MIYPDALSELVDHLGVCSDCGMKPKVGIETGITMYDRIDQYNIFISCNCGKRDLSWSSLVGYGDDPCFYKKKIIERAFYFIKNRCGKNLSWDYLYKTNHRWYRLWRFLKYKIHGWRNK